jgi:hypothetical protein
MEPEQRVFVERARARRWQLEALVAAIPEGYWDRRAPGDDWSARDHLAHLATVDQLVVELLDALRQGQQAWLGGPEPAALERRREDARLRVRGEPTGVLLATMRAERGRALAALRSSPATLLDGTVRVASVLDAWGRATSWSLRAYLASWIEHDDLHAEAIRRAITVPPDLSTVLLARRAR